MKNNDIKLNNQRITFSKKIKRKFLLEYASGKSPNEIFSDNLNFPLDKISNDKKYASKLLNKWKQELYDDKEILHFLKNDINNNDIQDEINSLGTDEELNVIKHKKYGYFCPKKTQKHLEEKFKIVENTLNINLF